MLPVEVVTAFDFAKGNKWLTIDATMPDEPAEPIVLEMFDDDNGTIFEMTIDYAKAEMVLDSGYYVGDC